MFELHELNRTVNEDGRRFKKLVESMEKYGWLDAYPVYCVKKGKRLKIIGGHHRFRVAQTLCIPVKYIVDDIEIPIHEIESLPPTKWTYSDFLDSYCKAGVESYVALKDYMDRTDIGITNAASMFFGESAGSHNCFNGDTFTSGRFKIKNTTHPKQVESIVSILKSIGVKYANSNYFVIALSKTLRWDGFDMERFKQKAKAHTYVFEKKRNVGEYLQMIEDVYNRQCTKEKRVPLVFLVEQAATERSAVYKKKEGLKWQHSQ